MENNKFKLDKSAKTLIIIFIVYLIIMVAIFLPGYLNRRGKLYIVTDNVRIKYDNGKWIKLKRNDEYKLKEFEIYEDGNHIGKYKLVDTNKIHLYENGKEYVYNGNIFAYNGSISLDVYDTEFLDSITDEDKQIIDQALTSLDISTNYELNYIEKKNIDVDNDGNIDTIYCINNYYSEDENNQKFSIVFIYKNNKINIIDKQITDVNGIEDSKIFYINKILDVKKDNKLELLYSSNYPNGSTSSECTNLYNLNKNKKIKDFCK